MPAAVAIPAAISAGTSVVGGLMGRSAANKAGQIQQQAAQAAADKVGAATGQANTGIADATANAQNLGTAGVGRVLDTAGQAKATSDEMTRNANALLNPYGDAGAQAAASLQAGLAPGGDFNKMPTLADLQMDPGYAWRLQQGQIAFDRSRAAGGNFNSGETLKDLANYSQGMASQEYQNAFNRFEQATQNRFGNVFNAARMGQDAAGQQGANLIGAARYGGDVTTGAANTALSGNEWVGNAGMQGQGEIGANLINGANAQGNFLTGGANAQAASKIAGANAISGALGGVGNAAMNAFTMNLLQNPATAAQNGPGVSTLAGLPQNGMPNFMTPGVSFRG